MEKIKSAAIRKNGVIYTGKSHWIIIEDISLTGMDLSENSEEGFITEEEKFVDRCEGAKIAFESGQINFHTERLSSCMIKESMTIK